MHGPEAHFEVTMGTSERMRRGRGRSLLLHSAKSPNSAGTEGTSKHAVSVFHLFSGQGVQVTPE